MRCAAIFLAVALAGCAVPRAVAPPPVRVTALPPPRPVPPPPADWRDWPVTAGTWRYARGGQASVARFVPAGLTLSCDADGQLRLWLDRVATAPVTVRTSSVARTLTPAAVGGPPAGVAIVLAARDPLLDAMAFSRGRFAIEQAGAAPLVVPAWAEVGRVIEDCRG